jgi:hypothetical protein
MTRLGFFLLRIVLFFLTRGVFVEKPDQIFRREAVEHRGAGIQEEGALLRLSPVWMSWAFWLLLAVVVFYGALGVFGRMSEYASGPAVVRLREGGPVEILAALPGSSRPLLAQGMAMRLELQGFAHQYQELRIEELGGVLLEPGELRESLGVGLAERLVEAPVVVVRARVPSGAFEAEGGRLPYFNGMRGTVSVRVRSERIAAALVPGLKLLLP